MTLLTRAPDVRVAAYTSVVEDIRMWVDAPDANPAEDLKAILDEHGCRGRKLGVEYEAYGLTGRNAKRVDAALTLSRESRRTFPTPFPLSPAVDAASYPARMVCPFAPRPVPGSQCRSRSL